MMTQKNKQINIILKSSINRRIATHKSCVRGLGLRRIGDSKTIEDTPENRGMIDKVNYLLAVEYV